MAVEYGWVDQVTTEKLGATLTQAAPVGTTTLHVDDTVDLDEDGGHLVTTDDGFESEDMVEYLTVDGDPESLDPTVTLADPLPSVGLFGTLAADTFLPSFDTELHQPSVQTFVSVSPRDSDDGEAIEALVPSTLAPAAGRGALVRIEETEPNRWEVTAVLDGKNSGVGFTPPPVPGASGGQMLRYSENSSGVGSAALTNFGAQVLLTGNAITIPPTDGEVWIEWAGMVNISACTSNSVVFLGLFEYVTDTTSALIDAATLPVPNGYTAPSLNLKGAYRLGPTTSWRTFYLAGYKSGTITVQVSNLNQTFGRTWMGAFLR